MGSFIYDLCRFLVKGRFWKKYRKMAKKKICRGGYMDTCIFQFQNKDSNGVQSSDRKSQKQSRSNGQAFTVKMSSERRICRWLIKAPWRACASYFLTQNQRHIVLDGEYAVFYKSAIPMNWLMMKFFQIKSQF